MPTGTLLSLLTFSILYLTSDATDNQNANVDQGFRAYDLVMGDPYNAQGDPGYRSHVFDPEDKSGNLAGHDKKSCSTNLMSEQYTESANFLQDTITTKGSSSSLSIGPEITVNAEIGANGVKVGASRTIPPIFTASSSNSNTMQKTLNTLDSKEFTMTKTVASCSLYDFKISEYQHPRFTSHFKNAVVDLSSCINSTKCLQKFFNNYGTHYIERAISGSKITAIKYYSLEEAASLKREGVQECSKKDTTWSFLGRIGGGSVSTECKLTNKINQNWSIHGLQRSATITVGSAPKNSLVDWAAQINTPEIITIELRPLSDLFTDDFMKGFANVIYTDLKPVLARHIENYCLIFKEEQRCNFLAGFEISLNRCGILSGFPRGVTFGKYTGSVNKEMRASTTGNDVGVLRHGSEEIVFSGQWRDGCPVSATPIKISKSSCTWHNTVHWGDRLQCSGDEVAVGLCGSGMNRDCDYKKFAHTLKCCKQTEYYNSNCKTSGSRYGIPINCRDRGGMLTGSCGAGENADCRGNWNEAVCCNGFILGREIQPIQSTCHKIESKPKGHTGWGHNLECGKDEVIVEKCGSGRNPDCANRASHAIVCCKLEYK